MTISQPWELIFFSCVYSSVYLLSEQIMTNIEVSNYYQENLKKYFNHWPGLWSSSQVPAASFECFFRTLWTYS